MYRLATEGWELSWRDERVNHPASRLRVTSINMTLQCTPVRRWHWCRRLLRPSKSGPHRTPQHCSGPLRWAPRFSRAQTLSKLTWTRHLSAPLQVWCARAVVPRKSESDRPRLSHRQGRRHGFFSGGRIVGRWSTYPQNTLNIRKDTGFGPLYSRIWRGRPLLNFSLEGTRPPVPPLSTPMLTALN